MNKVAKDILMHIGMPRRSGRYPWGSGKDPYQSGDDFVGRVKKLRDSGMKETEIAKAVGCRNTTDLRVKYSAAVTARRRDRMEAARAMADDGKTPSEIAKATGYPESTIRGYLDERTYARINEARNTADFLKARLTETGMLDVGAGVERELNMSKEKLKQALEILKEDGYVVYGGGAEQVTNPGQQTNFQVLCPPGTAHKDIYEAFDNDAVGSVKDYIVRQDKDGNDIIEKAFVYPASMDSNRIGIRYSEDGGAEVDGLVEIRRGVQDISLGESRYSQVRILVDDTHFIKGMAAYSDNMPDGVDIIFNTNKDSSNSKLDVFKKIKDDPDNPFGSLIKEKGGQSYYYDENGERKLSLINKRADEGDWGDWSDSLSSQFLSKQTQKLIDQQLNLAKADKRAELEEIMSLTNPTVKKEMLQSFADDCDAAAVHLQAAALPRQKYQVILPVPSVKDNEVYAPNYNDGETVALIRYPHGGTFEIPILKVNNKNSDAQAMMGNTPADAIGINAKVAGRLSGADFDGDTVMVIPCNSSRTSVKITSTRPLEALAGFDPKMEYPERKGMKYMRDTQKQMGMVSNLITDMTLKGANTEELARAVKHSMVVIDAEKHNLDYKLSEERNGIAALRKRYSSRIDEDTGKPSSGASTLISLAKSPTPIPRRVGSPKVNQKGKPWYDPSKPEGAVVWNEDKETYTVTKTNKRTGVTTTEVRSRQQRVPQMEATDDAFTLSSGTSKERAYANYANAMKALANEARKAKVYTKDIPYSPSAKQTYQTEVHSLLAKLNTALLNAPRERQAQLIARSKVEIKKKDNPELTNKEIRKIAQQQLTAARQQVGAKRSTVAITDKEWIAIQAGAVSPSRLTSILRNSDPDTVRKLATPRTYKTMTPAKVAKMKAYKNSGYTTAQIAEALGVSSSTISNYLRGEE